jgi:PKD repeat protein
MMNNFIVLKTFNASLSVVYFYKFNGTDFILYGSYSQGTTGSATLSNLSVESSFAFYGDGTTNLRAITFKPEATFSCNKTTGVAPLTVNFSAEDAI